MFPTIRKKKTLKKPKMVPDIIARDNLKLKLKNVMKSCRDCNNLNSPVVGNDEKTRADCHNIVVIKQLKENIIKIEDKNPEQN